MTHDNSYPVATKAMNLGLKKIYNSGQIVMGTALSPLTVTETILLTSTALDHDVSNQSESNLRKYRLIEEFARKHGTYFYPAGHGIAHQIMIDEGRATLPEPKSAKWNTLTAGFKATLGQGRFVSPVIRIRPSTAVLDASVHPW